MALLGGGSAAGAVGALAVVSGVGAAGAVGGAGAACGAAMASPVGAAGARGGSRYLPETHAEPARFTAISRAIRPGEAELARNPRARSSTLRHARRTAAPAREAA